MRACGSFGRFACVRAGTWSGECGAAESVVGLVNRYLVDGRVLFWDAFFGGCVWGRWGDVGRSGAGWIGGKGLMERYIKADKRKNDGLGWSSWLGRGGFWFVLVWVSMGLGLRLSWAEQGRFGLVWVWYELAVGRWAEEQACCLV